MTSTVRGCFQKIVSKIYSFYWTHYTFWYHTPPPPQPLPSFIKVTLMNLTDLRFEPISLLFPSLASPGGQLVLVAARLRRPCLTCFEASLCSSAKQVLFGERRQGMADYLSDVNILLFGSWESNHHPLAQNKQRRCGFSEIKFFFEISVFLSEVCVPLTTFPTFPT